jgi:hypothetical protein
MLTQNVSKLYCICKTSLYCPCYFNLRIVVIFKLSAILLSVLLRISACDYPFGTVKRLANALFVLLQFTLVAIPLVSSIVWTLHCLFCFNLRLVAIPLVSSNVWTWHCLSCFYSQLLITPSVSSNDWPFYYLFASFHIFWLPLRYRQTIGHFIICLLRFTSSDYPFVIFNLFFHSYVFKTFLMNLW